MTSSGIHNPQGFHTANYSPVAIGTESVNPETLERRVRRESMQRRGLSTWPAPRQSPALA
jgi:hypothetical protein